MNSAIPERQTVEESEAATSRLTQLYVETYGCQMNEYDSGLVRAILGEDGFRVVQSPEEAGVILLNTCAIREKAHEKVYNRLEALGYLKRRDSRTVIGVLGCMAQNLGDDLFAQGLPVDFIAGPDNYRALPEMIRRIRTGAEGHVNITQLSRRETYDEIEPQVVSGCLAFVTIMRGCDNFCSFCVVPYTRGRERSRTPDAIVQEIQNLVQTRGVREVTLLGQNVNSYRHAEADFTRLVERILGETDVARIRFTSPHPHDFPLHLLELMAREPRFASYIHLPVQSGATSTLARMKRDYTREEYLALVDRIRERIPDCGLSTDVIVGFCGETDAEFDETLSLVENIGFDMAFMFRYSERELTHARKYLSDDVSDDVKLARLNRLIELQNSIQRRRNAEEIGRTHDALVEGRSRKSAAELLSRNAANKTIVFPAPPSTHSDAGGAPPDPAAFTGRLARVRITGASSATLRGEFLAWL